jgi:hypothetical protein
MERAWTFQEIALSSKPLLVSGREQLSLKQSQECICALRELASRPPQTDCDLGRYELVSLDTLRKWEAICNVWTGIPRPCTWSGREFREPLTHGDRKISLYSIAYFLHYSNPRRVFAMASLVIAIVDCVVVGLALFAINGQDPKRSRRASWHPHKLAIDISRML